VLREFVPGIVAADFDRASGELELPQPIRKALVLHQGVFTPEYRYMNEYIKK